MVRYEDSYGDWYEYRLSLTGAGVEARSKLAPTWNLSGYFSDIETVHDYYRSHGVGFKLVPLEIHFDKSPYDKLPTDQSFNGSVFDYGVSTTSGQKSKCICPWATVWTGGCKCGGV